MIEAIGSGVRELPLQQLVARNHYVIVVRPSHMTAADRAEAVVRARTKVGAPFDIGGMFGFDAKDKWFCSELVAWASQTEARNHVHETVMTRPDRYRIKCPEETYDIHVTRTSARSASDQASGPPAFRSFRAAS